MDIRLVIYYLCILIGAAASAVLGVYIGKWQGFSKRTVGIYVALALVIGIFGAFFMGGLQNFIMSLTGLTYYPSRMRIFGGLLFTPPLIYFPVKYLAGDFDTVTDIFSPGLYLLLGFSKIGCAVYGCCYGIECPFGVSTPFEEHTVFPVQLLESLLCFLVFALMLYIVINKKHRKGTVYPLSMILYGVLRFLVEFLRYYPEPQRTYFFGMSFWQAVSILTVFVGIIWLIHKHHEGSRGLRTEDRQYEG